MCRKFTPISTDIDRENWVSEFSENTQVADITSVDSVKVENMEVKSKDCQTCERDDKHVKALYFCFHCNEQICRECRDFHLKVKALKHHIIADLESVERGRKRKTKILTDCVTHSGKEIKYFCHDHKTLCCSKCLFVTHRKCSDVAGVEDCLEKFKGKPDLSEIIKETKHMMDGIHVIQTNDRAVLTSLQSDVENVPRILDECRKRMLEAFNETCSRINKALKEKYTEECGKLNCHLRACKTLEDDLKSVQNVAQIVAEHGDDIQQFVATRRFGDEMAIHTRDMVRLTGDTTSVTIKPVVGDEFKRHVTELDKDFSVKVNVSIPNQCETNGWNGKQPISAQLSTTFSCAIPSDVHTPNITGLCVVSDSRRVLVDKRNRALKLYCPNHALLTFYKLLKGNPWNVVCVKDSQIAVSCECLNKIYIYDIINDKFKFTKNVNVTETAQLISLTVFTPGEIVSAVTVEKNHCHIQHISIDGTPTSPVTKVPLQIISAVALSPDGESIYMTSWTTNKLVKTDTLGNIKHTYGGLSRPLGLAVHPNGSLFVCSTAGKELIHLTPDLQLIQTVISADENAKPLHVVFNNDATEMWLSFEDSEHVRIYKI